MKTKLALVASLLVLAVACGDSSNGELEQLRAENERLLSEAQELSLAAEQRVLAPSPTPTSTSTPAPTTPTRTPTPTEPGPEPFSEPTPSLLVELLSPPVERYIGDTGGGGVSIRRGCAESARSPGAWAEGTAVRVTGTGIGECAGWSTAESGGTESWVSDAYLVSSPPQVVLTPPPTATSSGVQLPRLVVTAVEFDYGDPEGPTVRLRREGDLIVPRGIPVRFAAVGQTVTLRPGETVLFEYNGGLYSETLEEHRNARAISLNQLWNSNPGEQADHTVRVRFSSDRLGAGPWSDWFTFHITR